MKTYIIFEEDGIAMEITNAMLLKSLIGRQIIKIDRVESIALADEKIIITLRDINKK